MQYSILALVTLVAAVMASRKYSSILLLMEWNGMRCRQHSKGNMSILITYFFHIAAKRQAAAAAGQPTVQEAAMTNQAGEVVAFDSKNVYLDSVAKGL